MMRAKVMEELVQNVVGRVAVTPWSTLGPEDRCYDIVADLMRADPTLTGVLGLVVFEAATPARTGLAWGCHAWVVRRDQHYEVTQCDWAHRVYLESFRFDAPEALDDYLER